VQASRADPVLRPLPGPGLQAGGGRGVLQVEPVQQRRVQGPYQAAALCSAGLEGLHVILAPDLELCDDAVTRFNFTAQPMGVASPFSRNDSRQTDPAADLSDCTPFMLQSPIV
jgi:hypothetical protein